MAYAAVLWIVGLGCLIVATVGKEVTFGNIQLPATTEKRARGGMAGIGVLALVLGIVLFVRPNGAQSDQQSAAPTTPATAPTAGIATSSGSSQPTPGQTDSGSPGPASSTVTALTYLADLTPSGGTTPQSSSWSINNQPYAHSIGYAGECQGDTVNFAVHGSYQFLNATVGVNDNADQPDQGPPSTAPQIAFIVYGNPGGGAVRQIADVNGSWRNPGSIHINIRGATLLTLDTNPVGIACLGPNSIAFWGNAELVP